MAKSRPQKPYLQRQMKIIQTETAAEAESLVNALFEEAALTGGDLPEVQLIPAGSGYTIIIFNDVLIT